ncbi:MAG: coproporphyrinogen III oxidase [Alphaproteobacteria bacterium]|nr:MAG: coproporphyrinogen III oxidase [Alphaproteobacteria bacterium]
MKSLAVYIHWPYCLKKCPYCDFNSHVADSVDHDAWRDAFRHEIEHYGALLGGRNVSSIFFGGGTPSLMAPETVSKVIDDVQRTWNLSNDCEITLEANPTSIEAQKFRDFKMAGINRVSVGVQSLRDEQLQFLGREHSAKEALTALDIANQTFDRVSFDLIYARPNQKISEWKDELTEALQYAKGHMSLYQLTIENGTQFKTLRDSGRLIELDGDHAADMYDMTHKMMAEAGLAPYEISNYAAKGQESTHNLAYWRYQDYVGIGPGAHGRLTLPSGDKIATRNHKAPDIWMKNVTDNGRGAKPFEILDADTQMQERIMMGLRLREGIGLEFSGNKDIQNLFDHGFLEHHQGRVRVPLQHWTILDTILAKILLAL